MLTRIRSQLPLWRRALRRRRRTLALLTGALLVAALLPSALPALVPAAAASTTVVVAAAELPIGTELRSEERRVGKECGARWWAEGSKNETGKRLRIGAEEEDSER